MWLREGAVRAARGVRVPNILPFEWVAELVIARGYDPGTAWCGAGYGVVHACKVIGLIMGKVPRNS